MSIFSEHPNSVGETYWEHMRYACGKSWFIFKVAVIIFIHAIFPFSYKCEGSERIESLCDELTKRKSGAKHEEDCSLDSDSE